MKIPPRIKPEPKEKRFYVVADTRTHLSLSQEAFQRSTDVWTLCGAVLTAWVESGCPDLAFTNAQSDPLSPSPSPSQSVADDQEGMA